MDETTFVWFIFQKYAFNSGPIQELVCKCCTFVTTSFFRVESRDTKMGLEFFANIVIQNWDGIQLWKCSHIGGISCACETRYKKSKMDHNNQKSRLKNQGHLRTYTFILYWIKPTSIPNNFVCTYHWHTSIIFLYPPWLWAV